MDGGKQLLEDFHELNFSEPIHAAKMLRMAERHKHIASSWKSRQIRLICSEAREANASPKQGLKRIAKQIGGGNAKPLKFVARDGMTSDGGRKGTLTANPNVIDGIITRAWQNIYNGNAEIYLSW